jgi:beta-glucosidase
MCTKLFKRFAITIVIFLFSVFISGSGKINKKLKPYMNTKLKIENRVEDLLARMTLQEKIELLGGTGFATKPIKRLGIPELKMSDGPLGVRWEKSTAFPSGICMAATWDTLLINKIGKSIGEELKGKGRDVILGPCVNIARIPMGGRNFESFGEDPYLDSRMAVSYIKGVQSEGVAATVKHFAANNQEFNRMFINVKVSKRALNEIYLPAFKAAVKEAGALCVMAAYNKVNGEYCSENSYLLNKILKGDWKFGGLVMSDWGAVHSSIPTAQNGLDLEMPTGKYLNSKTLTKPVKSDEININTINDKIKRILTVMFKLGLFERQYSPNPDLINTKGHQKTAYKAEAEGIVLLKNNNNSLPLNLKAIKSIAVIGPNTAIARTGGGGSSMVSPVYSVSPLEALKNKLPKNIKINYAEGIKLVGDSNPIDNKFLFQPGNNKTLNGLQAEYFDNKNLKGKPVVKRIDEEINFEWGGGSPSSKIPDDNFSARWTGKLKAPKTGDFLIDVLSDDGVRLFINNKLVIDDWNDHAAQPNTYKMHFEEGKFYNIKLEYYEHTGGAVVKLGWRLPNEKLISSAISAAKNSDVALIFAGTSSNFESEGFDRPDLTLPGKQDDLIKKVAEANKNTIVIVTSGSPVLMNKWLDKVNAVVETWFGGDEIGNAIVDVLTGKFNPSGKLPVTFPKEWKDCSAYTTYHKKDSVSNYNDGIFVGYRYFDKENKQPLFPFGYGLSYTKFSFRNLKVKTSGDDFSISFDIKNTGKLKGAEVPQLYIHDSHPVIEKAPKELKRFDRIMLNPGETKTVKFNLTKNDFQYYDPAKNNWAVSPGNYEILIGNSSRNILLKDKIALK